MARHSLKGAVVVMTASILCTGAFAGSETGDKFIDPMDIPPEIAYKLVALSSYLDHKECPDSGSDYVYATTDRKLVDIRVLNPFNEVITMYLVTLYRGEGEPVHKEALDRAIIDWADKMAGYTERGEEENEYVPSNELTREVGDAVWDGLSSDVGGIFDYYFGVVAKSSPNSTYYDSNVGIPRYLLMPELGKIILSKHLGVEKKEIAFEGIDFLGYAVYEVGGKRYVVDTPVNILDFGPIRIISFEKYMKDIVEVHDRNAVEALSPYNIELFNRHCTTAADIPMADDWSVRSSDIIPFAEGTGEPLIGSDKMDEKDGK